MTDTTLSTGQTVRLPLETAATVTGALLSADREAVAPLLPDGLRPIGTTPGRAAVGVLAVEYHRIGDGAVRPYDELAVVLAATPERSILRGLTTGRVGGYVHSLPVTTEPARALGAEVWGFPKTVARVSHHNEGGRRTTSVVEDGDHVLTVDIDRPRTVPWSFGTTSYTVQDGRLESLPVELDGRIGVAPLSDVEVMLGCHERAETLRSLDLSERAIARFAFEGGITYGAGQPVE